MQYLWLVCYSLFSFYTICNDIDVSLCTAHIVVVFIFTDIRDVRDLFMLRVQIYSHWSNNNLMILVLCCVQNQANVKKCLNEIESSLLGATTCFTRLCYMCGLCVCMWYETGSIPFILLLCLRSMVCVQYKLNTLY